MRRVLVTGGASGIGSEVADLLESRDWAVVRADVQSAPDVTFLDVTNPDGWSEVLVKEGPSMHWSIVPVYEPASA